MLAGRLRVELPSEKLAWGFALSNNPLRRYVLEDKTLVLAEGAH